MIVNSTSNVSANHFGLSSIWFDFGNVSHAYSWIENGKYRYSWQVDEQYRIDYTCYANDTHNNVGSLTGGRLEVHTEDYVKLLQGGDSKDGGIDFNIVRYWWEKVIGVVF